MAVMVPLHPLVAENQGAFSLNLFYIFESLNFV